MERKSVEIFIPYNCEGKTERKMVTLSFISNRIIRDYTSMQRKHAYILQTAGELRSVEEKMFEISMNLKTPLKERKAAYGALKAEKNQLTIKLNEIANIDAFREKVELMIHILQVNGVKDPELLSFEFWDENVLPEDFAVVLHKAVSKDYPEETVQKKKN